MRTHVAVGATLAIVLLVGGAIAEEALKSGLQSGDFCTPFEPKHVTGPMAGQARCLVWAYGAKPVAIVFAREASAPVTSLVKKIDACTVNNKDKKMESFAVFMSDEEGLDKKLKDFAEKDKLAKCILTIDNPSGPKAYKIEKDADVTVLLYVNKTVKVNHSFKKGELNDAAIAKVLKDVPKIFEKD